MVCSNCGYALGPDDQFCGGCGAYLTDAPQAEAAQQPGDWGASSTPDGPPTSGPSGSPGSSLAVIGGVLAALVIVALALIWILGGRGDSDDVATDGATTPIATETAPATEPTDPATTPAESPTSPEPEETEGPEEPEEIELPGAAVQCNNVGTLAVYRGNDQTSCPFAENVARAFAALDQPVTEEVTLSGVSSPVTGQDYTLTCDFTVPVRCVGGNDAVIYISPSS